MKKPVALLALALGLGMVAPAMAVSIGTTPDTRPAAPQQRRHWKDVGANVELSGNYLDGNVSLLNLAASTNLSATSGPHQFFLDGGGMFTGTAGKTLVNRLSGSGLYAYAALDNFNLYAYTTHSKDQSIKLDYRQTLGAGLCLHKIAAPSFSLFLISLAPVFENSWFQGSGASSAWRTVWRLNVVKPLTDSAETGLDSSYAPTIANFGDFRVYGELFLKFKLSDALSLKLTAADEYDSQPQPGIRNNDFGVFTTLGVEWGR